MIRRPPRSTLSSSSAASDVYKSHPPPQAPPSSPRAFPPPQNPPSAQTFATPQESTDSPRIMPDTPPHTSPDEIAQKWKQRSEERVARPVTPESPTSQEQTLREEIARRDRALVQLHAEKQQLVQAAAKQDELYGEETREKEQALRLAEMAVHVLEASESPESVKPMASPAVKTRPSMFSGVQPRRSESPRTEELSAAAQWIRDGCPPPQSSRRSRTNASGIAGHQYVQVQTPTGPVLQLMPPDLAQWYSANHSPGHSPVQSPVHPAQASEWGSAAAPSPDRSRAYSRA
eukprot:TRINITY_DN17425_c0_g2_i1.p1 TRINITY_DN17425_c0_g2~~TRINITY_DN17425_c0_g2_i1.p1  ORF type:complete len:289 (-),score=46.83 TRINITY_DN17425_c0_g2_i1:122-988(-)